MPNRTEVTWQKPSRISTGRLPLLRLFSTLLAISLIDLPSQILKTCNRLP